MLSSVVVRIDGHNRSHAKPALGFLTLMQHIVAGSSGKPRIVHGTHMRGSAWRSAGRRAFRHPLRRLRGRHRRMGRTFRLSDGNTLHGRVRVATWLTPAMGSRPAHLQRPRHSLGYFAIAWRNGINASFPPIRSRKATWMVIASGRRDVDSHHAKICAST